MNTDHVSYKESREATERFVFQLALCEAELQTLAPLQQKSVFSSYATPERRSRDLQRIATLSETVCWFGIKVPPPESTLFFLGQATASWHKTRPYSCRVPAPVGRDPEHFWDITGTACPQGSTSGPAAFKLGQSSFTRTRKNHLFEIYPSVALGMPGANHSGFAKKSKRAVVALAAPFSR